MEESSVITLLESGEIDLEGRVTWGSNYTLLGKVCVDDQIINAIYKPRRGERPLWDFPSGTLCGRERAAYLISKALNWQIVPPTVLRDGPMGFGSVQLFIDHDPNIHYFNFQGDPKHDRALQKIVLFDLIVNNADRKAGHVLVDDNEKLWTIDHGLCFHEEHKLRTVIWDFSATAIEADDLTALASLGEQLKEAALREELSQLLNEAELAAVTRRIDRLVQSATFPEPGPGRHYPWPPV